MSGGSGRGPLNYTTTIDPHKTAAGRGWWWWARMIVVGPDMRPAWRRLARFYRQLGRAVWEVCRWRG